MASPVERIDNIDKLLENASVLLQECPYHGERHGPTCAHCCARQDIANIIREMPTLRNEISTLQQGYEDLKLIARAKGILMDCWRISEKEAHNKLQTAASARRAKLAEVARTIIEADAIANGK